MNKEEEMIIDRFVRKNAKMFRKTHYPIKPSDGFVGNVMAGCVAEEKKQIKLNCIYFVSAAIAPFLFTEAWLLLRNDYISVTELPFSSLINNIYGIFISPITEFVFLISGIVIASVLLYKSWKSLKTAEFKVRVS